MRRWVAAALALAPLVAGAAQTAGAGEASRWYLQMDNDFFFGTDRNYSSGLRLGRVAGVGEVQVEWGLLQEIYSPEATFASGGLWQSGVLQHPKAQAVQAMRP